jgi:CO/xanthine dehydrogenase Mo-binding subunit
MRLLLGYGDVDKGFAEADVVLEETYRTSMVHQGYIEPQAATARVEPDGRLTVWTTTQGSFTVRVQLHALLGVPESRIKVVPMEIGGGFGGKVYVHLEPLVALLAQKAGRPVKGVMSREEVLKGTGPGAPAVIRMKVGAKRDGTITAIDSTMYYDAGAFPGSPIGRAAITGPAPYKTPHLRVHAYDVITNKPRVEAYRAPGSTQAAFAFEVHMDRVAAALGLDPLEFRRRNCPHEGDLLPTTQPYNRIGLEQIYGRIAAHPCWTTPLATAPGKLRGRGLATGHWPGGAFTSSCRVTLNGDGSLEVVVGSVDLTGTRTTLTQIAAEEFGLDTEQITVTVGDTDSSDYTDVTGGSRITYTMGEALHKACQDVLTELRQRAANQLEANVDDLEYVGQAFRVKGSPAKAVDLVGLARASTRGEGVVMGHGTVSRMGLAHQFAVHVADVEVDEETGKITILKYTAFQDVGCAINPTQVEGQIQGGAVQGIGWALNEEYFYEGQQLRNPTLLDYRMPVALDLPMIDVELIEEPAPHGHYGMRGVGEVPIVPPPAALANAIANATGVCLRELPMHPGRVLTALLAHRGK